MDQNITKASLLNLLGTSVTFSQYCGKLFVNKHGH